MINLFLYTVLLEMTFNKDLFPLYIAVQFKNITTEFAQMDIALKTSFTQEGLNFGLLNKK